MDTTKRTITKSVTWQVAGLFTMTAIGFIFTGSLTASSGIAIAGSVTGFMCYFLHEIIWSKVEWGQHPKLISSPLDVSKDD